MDEEDEEEEEEEDEEEATTIDAESLLKGLLGVEGGDSRGDGLWSNLARINSGSETNAGVKMGELDHEVGVVVEEPSEEENVNDEGGEEEDETLSEGEHVVAVVGRGSSEGSRKMILSPLATTTSVSSFPICFETPASR